MPHFSKRSRRNTVLAALFTSAAVLTFVGIYALVQGFRGRGTRVAKSTGKDSQIMWSAIVFAAMMFFFASFSGAVIKKHNKRWPAITYAVMLFISTVIFVGIAIAAPIIRDEVKQKFKY